MREITQEPLPNVIDRTIARMIPPRSPVESIPHRRTSSRMLRCSVENYGNSLSANEVLWATERLDSQVASPDLSAPTLRERIVGLSPVRVLSAQEKGDGA